MAAGVGGLVELQLQERRRLTDVLVLGPRAARCKLSDYMVFLDGLSVSPCAEVKDLGVIIHGNLSFECSWRYRDSILSSSEMLLR